TWAYSTVFSTCPMFLAAKRPAVYQRPTLTGKDFFATFETSRRRCRRGDSSRCRQRLRLFRCPWSFGGSAPLVGGRCLLCGGSLRCRNRFGRCRVTGCACTRSGLFRHWRRSCVLTGHHRGSLDRTGIGEDERGHEEDRRRSRG